MMQNSSETELLDIASQVSAYAGKLRTRATAWQRARDVRELARECERIAERIERCQLTGAQQLREAAKHYAHVADNIDVALGRDDPLTATR